MHALKCTCSCQLEACTRKPVNRDQDAGATSRQRAKIEARDVNVSGMQDAKPGKAIATWTGIADHFYR